MARSCQCLNADTSHPHPRARVGLGLYPEDQRRERGRERVPADIVVDLNPEALARREPQSAGRAGKLRGILRNSWAIGRMTVLRSRR